jgi:hypothetical protein
MLDHLSKEFTAEEVYTTIKELKSLAAPGPDGLPAKFYHTYWNIIGQDITRKILHVLNHDGNPESLNSTHICLIPKTDKPTSPNEFRPISLCNVTLKIITKTIANRIKAILPDIISPNQSAFVPGRLISDNTLIANEVFHYLARTTKQTGYVGIKTDMAKAYDRLEWDFIQATLVAMNFPQKLVNTIMRCVTTVSFSILINGNPTRAFYPQRGLRQGDPLSPYLFIICADVFSALITNAQNSKLIHGVKIAPKAPEITYLFFADDSLIFCRANKEETNQIKSIITKYQQASGQLVNYNKSEVIFSRKVQPSSKHEINHILPMQEVHHFSKYLGQPTFIGRAKSQVFSYIQDRVWKMLKGWKEKNLSFAGRATLIKAVAQAIPTYLMSNYLIPKGLCHNMESMISNFWWGSNVDRKKIHWINWKKTCKQKQDGGMGFRDLSTFNEALLAKQGWRLITEPQSLVAQVLKAKYYPQQSFLKAKHSYRPSYSWQSIQKASHVLKRGCFWWIGNGKQISIWEDRWLHPYGEQPTWTPKPDTTNLHKVSDLMDPQNNQWNHHLINQTFFPMEANLITQIPIINPSEDDIISWQGSKDGIYTVKSGYHALMDWDKARKNQAQPSTNPSRHTNWKKFWKQNNPPKHLHLIWRILNNAIPVKMNLISKGITCDSLCPRCNNNPETIEHTFLKCDWARQVWFNSPLTITISNSLSLSFSDWYNHMLNNTSTECMQILSALIYNLWNARNNKIFRQQDIPATTTVNQALKILHKFHHNMQVRPILSDRSSHLSRAGNNISWSPPPRSYLKLNVDAHLNDAGR